MHRRYHNAPVGVDSFEVTVKALQRVPTPAVFPTGEPFAPLVAVDLVERYERVKAADMFGPVFLYRYAMPDERRTLLEFVRDRAAAFKLAEIFGRRRAG